MNKPVNFEIAKLLKEKGYENEDCESVYLTDFDEEYPPEKIELSTRNLRERTIGEFDYIAPSIAEVVMWLYEEHGIWISVDTDINGKFRQILRKHNSNDRAWEVKNTFFISEYYSSPTESYEAGIKHSLENFL